MVGFGSLWFATYRGLGSMGIALFIGVGTCFLASIIVIPVFVEMIVGKKNK
jgi:predicted RND superfamily exporter protein